MLMWLQANLGTILVVLVLLVIVGFIIRNLIKNKKAGQTSCGCGCEHCAMRDSCHQKAK